jgi:hypothetical protein
MHLNNERKKVFIGHLLDATARHLLLLSIQDKHLGEASQLQDMLDSSRQLLSGFTSSVKQRRSTYEAAAQAALQPRSNIDAGDTHLLQMLQALQPKLGAAALDLQRSLGAIEAQQEKDQQQQQLRAFLGFGGGRDEGKEGGVRTPRGTMAAAGAAAARTPPGR